MVQGGVAFDLYATEVAAKANPDGDPVRIGMHFDQTVRGLSVGAVVDFNGVVLGEVTDIDFDRDKKRFYAVVDAQLYPERDWGKVYDSMRIRAADDGVDTGKRLVFVMLKYGLRAQLHTASLITW